MGWRPHCARRSLMTPTQATYEGRLAPFPSTTRGRDWDGGLFSVIDLFLVNALTLVTEFIGISLALEYFGIPRQWGVCASA